VTVVCPTANLKVETMRRLAILRGWLEIRDKKIYSVDAVVEYLLDSAPKVEFEVNTEEGMSIEHSKTGTRSSQ
jgi:hypothetical protein